MENIERRLKVEHVRENLTDVAMLAQIAEEAAEFAKAAVKIIRIIDDSNPTPVKMKDAIANFHEEFADVLNACAAYGLTEKAVRDLMDDKLDRWCQRIDGGCE
jgi:NTP pyrophosphatase (non-canonical NTP hydrolase)